MSNLGKTYANNKVEKPSDEKFREIIARHKTLNGIARELGLKYRATSTMAAKIKHRCIRLGIDITNVNWEKPRPVVNRCATTTLRSILEGYGREYVCHVCNCEDMTMGENGEWQWKGHDLPLEINHMYGVGFHGCDHPKNLAYFCAACHRQHSKLLVQAKAGLRSKFTIIKNIKK